MNRLTKAQKAELGKVLDGFIEELEQRFRPDATEEELVEAVKDYFYYSFTGDLRTIEWMIGEHVMEQHAQREADSPLNGRDCHFVHHAVFKVFFHFIDLVEPHIKQMVAEYMKGEFESAFPKGGL